MERIIKFIQQRLKGLKRLKKIPEKSVKSVFKKESMKITRKKLEALLWVLRELLTVLLHIKKKTNDSDLKEHRN